MGGYCCWHKHFKKHFNFFCRKSITFYGGILFSFFFSVHSSQVFKSSIDFKKWKRKVDSERNVHFEERKEKKSLDIARCAFPLCVCVVFFFLCNRKHSPGIEFQCFLKAYYLLSFSMKSSMSIFALIRKKNESHIERSFNTHTHAHFSIIFL